MLLQFTIYDLLFTKNYFAFVESGLVTFVESVFTGSSFQMFPSGAFPLGGLVPLSVRT